MVHINHLLHTAADGLRSALRRDEGQGMVEYSLIVGLISLALVFGFTVTNVDGAIQGLAQDVVTAINLNPNPTP
jgi:Flp pilus assembly pilin Flp